MGNIGTTIKRFLSNKNTVTLIAIIICTVIVYAIYSWRVKSAVSTTYVCQATQTIPARTEITNEMVSTTKILSSQKSKNMITSCDQVIGKYASYATEIPENSYFYDISVLDADEMPNSAFENIPDGHMLFNMNVSFESTYANSIFPGDYIDLFIHTEDTQGMLVYGKFIQSIKVLAVKDSEGRNVFETTIERREPAQIHFAVPEDLYLLLKRAQYLGVEIVLVPRNKNYTAEAGATEKSSAWLEQLIVDQTADIPDECIRQTTGVAECRRADDIDDNGNNNNDDNNGDNPTPNPTE